MEILLIIAAIFLFFLVLPAFIMTLRFFSRKQIRDFDSFAPDESLGHYEPYREAILKDMAYMFIGISIPANTNAL